MSEVLTTAYSGELMSLNTAVISTYLCGSCGHERRSDIGNERGCACCWAGVNER